MSNVIAINSSQSGTLVSLNLELLSGKPEQEVEVFQKGCSIYSNGLPYAICADVDIRTSGRKMPSNLSVKNTERTYSAFTYLLSRTFVVLLAAGIFATVSAYLWDGFWAKFLGPLFFTASAGSFWWCGHRVNREHADN